jgi:hypothetical protein
MMTATRAGADAGAVEVPDVSEVPNASEAPEAEREDEDEREGEGTESMCATKSSRVVTADLSAITE